MVPLFQLLLILLVRSTKSVSCNGCACLTQSTGNTCSLNCNTSDTCHSSTLTCQTGLPCIIICSAAKACENRIIDGSTATHVTVYCSQQRACKGASIRCGTGDCLLDCTGNATDICLWSQVSRNIETRSFQCVGNQCDKLNPPSETIEFSPSPTMAPTLSPTIAPSQPPSQPPTNAPSSTPTNVPSFAPTLPPSISTYAPSIAPSGSPSQPPTISPSVAPSDAPSFSPSLAPSAAPTYSPSDAPSDAPSIAPSIAPTYIPTIAPSLAPSLTPSHSPSQPPTTAPSLTPTNVPSLTPTFSPSFTPTIAPSLAPSGSPSQPPTLAPSAAPSLAPSSAPSAAPTVIGTQAQVEIFIYYNMSKALTDIILSVFNDKLSYATFLGIKYGAYQRDYQQYKFLYDAYTCVVFTLSSFDTKNDPDWNDELFDCDAHKQALAKNKKELANNEKYSGYIPARFGAQYLGIIKLIITGNDMAATEQKVTELTNILAGTITVEQESDDDTDRRRLQQKKSFFEYTENCMNQEIELERELEDGESCKFLGLDLDDFKIIKLNAELVTQPLPPPQTVISFAEKVVNVLKYIIYVFVGTCFVVSIFGNIYAKRIGSDNVKPFGILFFALYTWDFYSDVMFCVRLGDATEWLLFAIGIIFIFIPWSMNLLQLFQAQKKWFTDNTVQEGVRGWFVDWNVLLVVAVCLSGNSFGAIELANSNLFGIDLFSMGLNPRHLKTFQSKRFYSSVIGENIPQLIVQIYFLTLLGSFDEATFIALLSSSISLLLSVVDIWSTKRLVNVMDDLKDDDIDINSIEFTVLSNDEIKQEKQILLTKPRALAKAIAETLVVDARSVEVYQLIAAENGIKVGFTVYAMQYNLHSMIDDLIEEETKLKLLLTNYWALKQYPHITQIQEGQKKLLNTDNKIEIEYKINNINKLNPYSKNFVTAETHFDRTMLAGHIPLNRMRTPERKQMKVADPEYKLFLARPKSKSETWRPALENEEDAEAQTLMCQSLHIQRENSISGIVPISVQNERNRNQHQQWALYLTNIGKLLEMRYKLQSKYNEKSREADYAE